MDLNQMNTVTKLLTSPLLSARLRPALAVNLRLATPALKSCFFCQSSPGHARHKYVLPVNHRQATPLPCLLHKQQQLERE